MRALLFSVCALLIASSALAQISVEAPWVRESLPQQRATGAFMRLQSVAGDARLVAVSTPRAQVAEIHEMSMENNIARMRRVDAVVLKAGQMVELEPGGYHLMLMDLEGPLRSGQSVPLTLTFEHAGGQRETVTVDAPVRPLHARGDMHHPK